ncbi:MAG: hypothetical protein WC428_01895 [Candidatus Paceibacterota bacterium]
MNLFGSKQTKGLQTFEEVRNYLNNIDSINRGGCGISALSMYRWLKKHGQTTEHTAFYFLDNDSSNHENNQEYFTNKEVVLRASSHIVLLHNDQTIDSTGFHSINDYDYNFLEKSEEYLLAMINNVWTWNYKFERKAHVKNIAKTLGINLTDVQITHAW